MVVVGLATGAPKQESAQPEVFSIRMAKRVKERISVHRKMFILPVLLLLAGECLAGGKAPGEAAWGKELTLDLGNKVMLKLVQIPAGKFLTGSPKGEKDRQDDEGLLPGQWVNGDAQIEVTISKPFYMGVYEVTVDQFAAFVKDAGQKHDWPDFKQTGDHPVVNVSWDDAQAFCKWLSKKIGKTVVLPTEAQWEYACRAGSKTRFSFGDKDEDFCKYGNYCDKSNTDGFAWQDKEHSDGFAKTAPVGSLKPNAWGLYDMHGNVWEWCSDWYAASYATAAANTDPTGPANGGLRVLRGGSWCSSPGCCRSAYRFWNYPGVRGVDYGRFGFRVAVVDGDDATPDRRFFEIPWKTIQRAADTMVPGDTVPASLPAADVERLARDIAAEAAKPNGDAKGYPLPLLGHWNTGQRQGGFSPDWQMAMIRQGHYLLPWFLMPGPGEDSTPIAYYESAIKQAARLHLPISLVSTQWERLLTDDAAYFNLPAEKNPNVVTPEGKILKRVCPFGPAEPWKEVGRKWTGTEMLAKVQQWYPDPPRVLFVSNNEHSKLTWTEAETSGRYLAKYGKGRDDDFKRKVIGEGWIERYRAFQQAMREGLSDGWKDKAVFVGYDAFGPVHLGRWDGWMEYSLTTRGRIDPWPLAWEGGSPSYYTPNGPCNDNTVWSPQIESMNWLFMLDEAWKLNPKFWWEISIWDGHEPKLDSDKRKAYAKLGQSASPDRYGGFVRFGLWLLRPRVAREYRGYLDTVEYERPYTEALMAAVDQVHREPTLRAFWRKGRLAPNPNGQHPYQRRMPEEHQKSQRWYLLDTDLTPAQPWKLDTQIPVFALALKLGDLPRRQWLIYAHAPAGPRQAVKIDLPGYGQVTANVAVEGTFLVVDEAGKTVKLLLPEAGQPSSVPYASGGLS